LHGTDRGPFVGAGRRKWNRLGECGWKGAAGAFDPPHAREASRRAWRPLLLGLFQASRVRGSGSRAPPIRYRRRATGFARIDSANPQAETMPTHQASERLTSCEVPARLSGREASIQSAAAGGQNRAEKLHYFPQFVKISR